MILSAKKRSQLSSNVTCNLKLYMQCPKSWMRLGIIKCKFLEKQKIWQGKIADPDQ